MPGHYLPAENPDLEDFFAQVVPTPPPTNRVGGVVFMAPFDATLERWFAYLRSGDHVDRFEGTRESVWRWARTQDVTERWIYETEPAGYVPMSADETPTSEGGH